MGQGDPKPVLQEGRDPPLLAIHGWGGTPMEVELVLDVARDLGLRRHAPLLPGHGTNARDLAGIDFDDWSRAANDALETVAPRRQPVVVAGLSLGSVLALHLAATRPERVLGLVVLANAVWLSSPFPSWALRLVRLLKLPDFHLPKTASDIADPEARRSHLTYSSQPMHSALQVLQAGERIRPALGHVRCPVFIAHGRHDHVCPVANARRVAERLGSRDTEVVILQRSRHIVTRDVDRDSLRVGMRRFVERLTREGTRAS